MGNLKFSVMMLRKEYKQSLIYTLTLALTIAVTFLFFNIIDNRYLMENSVLNDVLTLPFSTTLSFIIILFCAFMIIFANSFYVSRKTKEIAIMTMSGSSFLKITLYLFYQNMVMTVIAFPIGLLIGYLMSIGVNQVIYQILHHSVSLFYIPMNAFGDTLICILAIIFTQLMYVSGYVYRHDIQYLLKQENTIDLRTNKLVPIPSFFYMIVYVFGIVLLCTTEYEVTSSLVPCFVGVLGIGGMIKYCFGSFFTYIKKKKYLKDSICLISFSYLYTSLRKSVFLIQIYAVSLSTMVAIMIQQYNSPREMVTAIIGFVVMMLLLLASLLYKYSMDIQSRKTSFYNLYKLGYSSQSLVKIVLYEVIGFYGIVFLLPFIYVVVTLVLAYIHSIVSIGFVGILLGVQILFVVIVGVITLIIYKNAVLQQVKEGMHYE